jgi:carbon storage regulator
LVDSSLFVGNQPAELTRIPGGVDLSHSRREFDHSRHQFKRITEVTAMLVLSRKKNESIIIDGHIVTVVEIRGDKIKLGIEAPREINVDRLEVWEAKQRTLTNKAVS